MVDDGVERNAKCESGGQVTATMNIPGFSREIVQPDNGCIGIFGGEGSGKTRLCCTATQWAQEHGTIPGWLICDRKTRKTVKDYHAELGLDLPYMNQEEFLSQKDAIALATNTYYDEVKKAYERTTEEFFKAVVKLAGPPKVNPIIVDSGTWVWDAIGFSHFGRKHEVGKSRVWAGPKQDWIDLMDGLQHKLVLITLKAKDEYRNDNRTGKQTWDGPPHLGYCTTSVVRCRFESTRPLVEGETYIDRFALDVVESQDNVALAGQDNVLTGAAIDLGSLLAALGRE